MGKKERTVMVKKNYTIKWKCEKCGKIYSEKYKAKECEDHHSCKKHGDFYLQTTYKEILLICGKCFKTLDSIEINSMANCDIRKAFQYMKVLSKEPN